MNLLSANDFDVLKKAMRRDREICLERELGDVSVTAKTFQVKDPWPVLMIVQIRMENKHCAWFQNFMRVEDAKKALDDWDDHFHWIGG